MSEINLSVWKTINTGAVPTTKGWLAMLLFLLLDFFQGKLKSNSSFIRALKQRNTPPWILDVIKNLAFEKRKKRVDLVLVTAPELGLPDYGNLMTIIEAGEKIGLLRCGPEVGIQLALQCKPGDIKKVIDGQVYTGHIQLAMEPIQACGGDLMHFGLSTENGLGSYNGAPDVIWTPCGCNPLGQHERVWVFIKPSHCK